MGRQPLDNEAFLRQMLQSLQGLCDLTKLDLSVDLIAECLGDIPRGPRELRLIHAQIINEMKRELYLHVPSDKAKYWQMSMVLSDEAKGKFPGATRELLSAANCYALALPTACIFHCMRALEHGLGALARDVGLEWTKENWHNIIEMIESKVGQERRELPKGLPKDERLNFLSTAAKEFMYFKDGWRNYVAHNRVSYEEPEALLTLDHTRSFVERLAKNLKESPYHYG